MKLLLRLSKWLFGTLLALMLLALAIMYVKDPVLTTRLLTMNQGPEAVVAGGPLYTVPLASTAQQSINDATLAAAITYGEATNSQALLVYQNGSLQLEHYFPGYDASTLTPTQSMHKSVLAMLIGIAIRDGYIPDVDVPASRWLTEWAADERSKITIRQMLQQVSGIDFASFSANPTGGFFQMMLGDNIKPLVLNNGVLFPPDQEFDYNSVNPQALGILLERATGMPYAEYLSTTFWQKLGAPPATVVLDSNEHGMARTFCCLQATARSWLHIGLLHLQQGRLNGQQIVPSEWIEQIQTPGAIQPNYGYLTWLGQDWTEHRYYNRKTATYVLHSAAYTAKDVIYFDGMGGQRVYIIPSADMVIVRTGAIAMDWDDAQLPNLLTGPAAKP